MTMRILVAAVLLAGSTSLAIAQSSTATSGTTQPMKTSPSSSTTMPNGQPKYVPPPAARSGEKGLRVGDGAVTGDPVEIRRVK